jgi:hypothetical protein
MTTELKRAQDIIARQLLNKHDYGDWAQTIQTDWYIAGDRRLRV